MRRLVSGHEAFLGIDMDRPSALKSGWFSGCGNTHDFWFCRGASVGIAHGESDFVLRCRFQEQHAAGKQIPHAIGAIVLVHDFVVYAEHGQRVLPLDIAFAPKGHVHSRVPIAVALHVPAKSQVLQGGRVDEKSSGPNFIHARSRRGSLDRLLGFPDEGRLCTHMHRGEDNYDQRHR